VVDIFMWMRIGVMYTTRLLHIFCVSFLFLFSLFNFYVYYLIVEIFIFFLSNKYLYQYANASIPTTYLITFDKKKIFTYKILDRWPALYHGPIIFFLAWKISRRWKFIFLKNLRFWPFIQDQKILKSSKKRPESNSINLLNPWPKTWYQDNSIERKGKKTKNINFQKKLIKKKFLQVLPQIKCQGIKSINLI